MSKILHGRLLNQFINECFKNFDDEIFNVIITLNNKVSKCVINGYKHVNMDRSIIKRYMYNENKSSI